MASGEQDGKPLGSSAPHTQLPSSLVMHALFWLVQARKALEDAEAAKRRAQKEHEAAEAAQARTQAVAAGRARERAGAAGAASAKHVRNLDEQAMQRLQVGHGVASVDVHSSS